MKKIIVILIATLSVSFGARAQVAVSVAIAPPALPVYVQPACPVDGYLWEPGYWAYGDDGYYWVSGVWVAPPQIGFLWTPCWWGFEGGHYLFHEGYWGPTVGFYGGVNYGFGYYGAGFVGGRWNGGRFEYNSAVWRVGPSVHNVYVDRTVVGPRGTRASFNGPGGYTRQPTEAERGAEKDSHVVRATQEQQTHRQSMVANKGAYFNANHGRPASTSMDRVGGHAFNAKGKGGGGRKR
jgi:hypothetical protein